MHHMSSMVIRDRILSMARAFHDTYQRWPTREELAAQVGVSQDVLRYHANILIEHGTLLRIAGGALQVVEHADTQMLAQLSVLDYHILAILRREQDAGAEFVTTAQLKRYLAQIVVDGKPLNVQRYTISRRCRSLIERGHVTYAGTGYRLVDPTHD